jgi:NAD(P)-dependent dehydrogenase (short-subunit alcohol dehydrogenase family)
LTRGDVHNGWLQLLLVIAGSALVGALTESVQGFPPLPAVADEVAALDEIYKGTVLADTLVAPGLLGFTRFGYRSARKHWNPVSAYLRDHHILITGATSGLGLATAEALAARGAKVVVNDLGGARDGSGGSVTAAEAVVAEIEAAGGEAMPNAASVTDFAAVQAMVEAAMAKWGRVDLLVNNAGVLRDKTFAKMELEDFRFVVDVHLMGAVNCTKAVWEIMRGQNYGRIVMTTSSSGLYGNFGQSNYGAAKMALVGLMQTLSIEGAKNDIRVNCLAPTAHTRMTEDLGAALPLEALDPALVTPGLLYLLSREAPSRCILAAGAGGFERAFVTLTEGVHIAGPDAPEQVAARFDAISDRSKEIVPEMGAAQGMIELTKAQKAHAS